MRLHSYRAAVENSQLNQYIPVLMLFLLAVTFAFGVLIISVLFGVKGKRNKVKDIAYECGMLPIGEGPVG